MVLGLAHQSNLLQNLCQDSQIGKLLGVRRGGLLKIKAPLKLFERSIWVLVLAVSPEKDWAKEADFANFWMPQFRAIILFRKRPLICAANWSKLQLTNWEMPVAEEIGKILFPHPNKAVVLRFRHRREQKISIQKMIKQTVVGVKFCAKSWPWIWKVANRKPIRTMRWVWLDEVHTWTLPFHTNLTNNGSSTSSQVLSRERPVQAQKLDRNCLEKTHKKVKLKIDRP